MNFKQLFISSALALTLVAGTTFASFAKTLNITVKSGRTQVLVRFSLFNQSDCGAAAYPKFKIFQPANGTLTVKKFRGKLTVNGHCNGKLARGMSVSYTSNRGYRGADAGKVNFRYFRSDDGDQIIVNQVKFRLRVK